MSCTLHFLSAVAELLVFTELSLSAFDRLSLVTFGIGDWDVLWTGAKPAALNLGTTCFG